MYIHVRVLLRVRALKLGVNLIAVTEVNSL